jgi:hypothetical protein
MEAESFHALDEETLSHQTILKKRLIPFWSQGSTTEAWKK